MSIPLVQNNEKDSINTSIIAIKKNLERINSLLGLADSSEPDLSGLATKQELEDAVTEINNTIDEVETSLQPVNAVTSGDMHSVTSNAVASAFGVWTTIYDEGGNGSCIKGCKMQWGTLLRIRFSGRFGNFQSTQYMGNGYLLYTLPEGWRPIYRDPNRCLIGVDTNSVRLPANIDIHSNGNVNIYFEGNTPVGGGVDNVGGLFGDVLLLLL